MANIDPNQSGNSTRPNQYHSHRRRRAFEFDERATGDSSGRGEGRGFVAGRGRGRGRGEGRGFEGRGRGRGEGRGFEGRGRGRGRGEGRGFVAGRGHEQQINTNNARFEDNQGFERGRGNGRGRGRGRASGRGGRGIHVSSSDVDAREIERLQLRRQGLPDCTSAWLAAIATHSKDIEVCRVLIDYLKAVHADDLYFPPFENPPVPAPLQTNKKPNNAVVESVSCFFLLLRVLIAQSELFCSTAGNFHRNRDWVNVALMWSAAYAVIQEALLRIDPFYTIELYFEEFRGYPPGEFSVPFSLFNRNQYAEIKTTLFHERDCIEDKKTFAIEKMKKYQEKLMLNLSALLGDRNIVKKSWGDNRWKNNPAPKHDYSAKIAELRSELKALDETIVIVENLQLFGSRV